jgi:hypothetical protein
MSDQPIEKLITNAIHAAFIKYPEGNGGPRSRVRQFPNQLGRFMARRQRFALYRSVTTRSSRFGHELRRRRIPNRTRLVLRCDLVEQQEDRRSRSC